MSFNCVYPPLLVEVSEGIGTGTARPLGFTKSEFERNFLRRINWSANANMTADYMTGTPFESLTGDYDPAFYYPSGPLPTSEFYRALNMEFYPAWDEEFYEPGSPGSFGWSISLRSFDTPDYVLDAGLYYPRLEITVGAFIDSGGDTLTTNATLLNTPTVSSLLLSVEGTSLPIYYSAAYGNTDHYSGSLDIRSPASNGFFTFDGKYDATTGELV